MLMSNDLNAAAQNIVTAINGLTTAFGTGTGAPPYVKTFLDRNALRAANVPANFKRIYLQYYDSTQPALNSQAAAPHISGHWMAQHTMSASGTNAQRLALPWGDAQTGQYFLETDVTPNLVWWWLSDLAVTGNQQWYQAGSIGYAWDTSNNGKSYWQIDEIEPNALQVGALNSTVFNSDDTIPLQDLCYLFAIGMNVFVPAGWYFISSSLQIATFNNNTFRGEGTAAFVGTQIFYGGSNGITIVDTFAAGFFNGNLKDFCIASSGGSNDAIHSPTTINVKDCQWENVQAAGARHGFYIGAHFSFLMLNCFGRSGKSGGCAYAMSGGVGTALIRCDGSCDGTLTSVFRAANAMNFYSCNPVFGNIDGGVSIGAYGYLLGAYNSISATAQTGSSNTITLAAGSTSVTDQPVALDIVLTGGTGSGQTRRIIAYSSATQVATINSTWVTNPTSTTTYTIQDPIDIMQGAPSLPQWTVYAGNCEGYTKNGIRTFGDSAITINGVSFINTATPESAMRFPPNNGNSNIFVYNATFNGAITGGANIMSEGVLAQTPAIGATYYNVPLAKLETFGVGLTSSVGGLPSAGSVPAGTRAFVTDSNATTFHNTVASGGANKVPVVSDGSNWLIG